MKASIPLLAAAALAACATTADPDERRVAYTCDRGPPLQVVFAGDTARVETQGGAPIVMQRRESASGMWYESATHSLRGQGNEITYTIGRMAPITCTATGPTPR